MRAMANKRLLLASIHDVSPRFENEVDRLLALLRPYVGDRVAMLVVPNHWGSAPIVASRWGVVESNEIFQVELYGASGAIVNPGGLTQHGVSLHDCIKAMPFPVIEVHMSNLHAR